MTSVRLVSNGTISGSYATRNYQREKKKKKTFGIFVSFGLEILEKLLHSGRRFLYPRIVAVGIGLVV